MRIMSMVFLILLGSAACSASNYIYKSPNDIDSVRLVKAKSDEKEGGLVHPHDFSREQMKSILASFRFNKKVILMSDLKEEKLFEERHVELLQPYLIEAFKKAGPGEVVSVSFFTQGRRYGVMDERLTVFRTFVKEDGLHVRFKKVFAKMIGDRSTKDPERVMHDARGLRVSLEPQTGQQRVSWDPEELVLDLTYDFSNPDAVTPTKEIRVKMKQQVASKKEEAPKGVREKLKELERLKDDELITEKEYEKKRKELIREL